MAKKFKWIIWLQKWLARHGVKYYSQMILQINDVENTVNTEKKEQ